MELTYSTAKIRETTLPGPLPPNLEEVHDGDSGWASFKKCFELQTEHGPVFEQGRFVSTLFKKSLGDDGHSITLQVSYRVPADPETYNLVWIQLTDEAASVIRPIGREEQSFNFEVDFQNVTFKPLGGGEATAVAVGEHNVCD